MDNFPTSFLTALINSDALVAGPTLAALRASLGKEQVSEIIARAPTHYTTAHPLPLFRISESSPIYKAIESGKLHLIGRHLGLLGKYTGKEFTQQLISTAVFQPSKLSMLTAHSGVLEKLVEYVIDGASPADKELFIHNLERDVLAQIITDPTEESDQGRESKKYFEIFKYLTSKVPLRNIDITEEGEDWPEHEKKLILSLKNYPDAVKQYLAENISGASSLLSWEEYYAVIVETAARRPSDLEGEEEYDCGYSVNFANNSREEFLQGDWTSLTQQPTGSTDSGEAIFS